jgi:hypothetical protein
MSTKGKLFLGGGVVVLKIKGSPIIDVIKWRIAKYGEKETDRLFNLLDPEVKKTFQNTIITTEWYPMDHFIRFLELDVGELYKGNPEALIGPSEEILGKQLRGIYSLFVKLGSPEFVIKRLSTVNSTYFIGIEVKPNVVAPGKVVIKYTGLEKQHRIFEYVLIGFYKKALEISGAKNINVSVTTSIADGKGYTELTVTWDHK